MVGNIKFFFCPVYNFYLFIYFFWLFLFPINRFGRDNFHEALKISNRVDPSDIDWTNFKYMVFDTPNTKGTYQDRYSILGKQYFP